MPAVAAQSHPQVGVALEADADPAEGATEGVQRKPPNAPIAQATLSVTSGCASSRYARPLLAPVSESAAEIRTTSPEGSTPSRTGADERIGQRGHAALVVQRSRPCSTPLCTHPDERRVVPLLPLDSDDIDVAVQHQCGPFAPTIQSCDQVRPPVVGAVLLDGDARRLQYGSQSVLRGGFVSGRVDRRRAHQLAGVSSLAVGTASAFDTALHRIDICRFDSTSRIDIHQYETPIVVPLGHVTRRRTTADAGTPECRTRWRCSAVVAISRSVTGSATPRAPDAPPFMAELTLRRRDGNLRDDSEARRQADVGLTGMT